MKRVSAFTLSAILLVFAGACAPKQEAPAPSEAPQAEVVTQAEPAMAIADLQPRADGSISGSMTFTQTATGVNIVAHINGASPGLHGFHLHEVGDCSAEDFTSAGGHFNPTGAPHGAPTDAERHAGDLGNIEVGEDGMGHLEQSSDMLTVASGPNSVIGRAVILHEGEDDLVSQPTGAAGGRLACGLVTLYGNEEMPGHEEMAEEVE